MAEQEIIIPEIMDDNEQPRVVPMRVTGYGPSRVQAYAPPVAPVYQPEPPFSMLAVLSLICAIAAVPLWWTLLPAPLAVIFGSLARGPISRGERGGYRTAKFGRLIGLIELGIAGAVFVGLAVFSIISWFSSPYTTK